MDQSKIKEALITSAQRHANELREFRLTGDLNYLYSIIEETICALSEPDADWNSFNDSLTNNEIKAFGAIFEAIEGNEGNISIVKMLQKTSLSRTVFTSLLSKMEKYKIAEVTNQGVKGTHIKLKKIN